MQQSMFPTARGRQEEGARSQRMLSDRERPAQRLPLRGSEATPASMAVPADQHPHIYYIGLILVFERSVTAWWNSWWISFRDTLPILIYFGADGHIPHPPAALLLSCGSPRKRGCRVGRLMCVPRGQDPVPDNWEAQIKCKNLEGP